MVEAIFFFWFSFFPVLGLLRGGIGRFLGLPVLLDLGKQLLNERRVGGPEGSFGVAEVELDGLNGLLHDVGELLPNRQIAPSGHLLDEGDDLVFHVFVDGVGLAGRGADEVDVLDDGLDVVGDELRGRALGAFGLLTGFVIVVEEGDEVVDEGQIGDGPEHLVLALPHLLGFLDVDVFAFGVCLVLVFGSEQVDCFHSRLHTAGCVDSWTNFENHVTYSDFSVGEIANPDNAFQSHVRV